MSNSLDPRYFITADLEEFFIDKDSGLPLANGTLEFFSTSDGITPKPVFMLVGTVGGPWTYATLGSGNTVTLSAVGTVQDSGGNNVVIYYYPWETDPDTGNLELDLYYVVCKNSNGVMQFTRTAWPNLTDASSAETIDSQFSNQIANPQFADVFINNSAGLSTTYTVSGTGQDFAFAPGWDFICSGSGSVIVKQVPQAGNSQTPTSPPYAIDVNVSAGVTSCYLRQRFSTNSGLWSSISASPAINLYLSTSLTAGNQNGGTVDLQMFYNESSGGSPVVIFDNGFINGSFQTQYGIASQPLAQIPTSTNPDTGPGAYIDIYISFPASSHVQISSVQVVPVTNPLNNVQYNLNSTAREEALLGSYYIPALKQKQIPSFLVGWDFTVNPFQFGATGSIATTPAYICDQTIAVSETSNVTFARDAVTNGLQLTTGGTNDAFYLMQYLSGGQVHDMIDNPLSVNVFGYKGSVGSTVTMQVYLLQGSSSATIPTLPAVLGIIDTSGNFTLTASNWTIMARSGLDTAKATLNTITTNDQIVSKNNDFGFSQWEMVDATTIGNTGKFAIIVTFGYVTTSTVITINSISVVPGNIPCRPAIQSFDQVLAQCQHYYEKTTNADVLPSSGTKNGMQFTPQFTVVGTGNIYPRSLNLVYKVDKRTAATITFYDLAGDVNKLYLNAYQNNGSLATFNIDNTGEAVFFHDYTGNSGCTFNPVNRSVAIGTGLSYTGSTGQESLLYYHYTADARLGIV